MSSTKYKEAVSDIFVSKFNAYDAFGYFIPGGVLLIGLCVLSWAKVSEEILNLNQYFLISDMHNTNWQFFISAIPIILLLVYVLGHFVASVSAILIDKLIVERTLGYPVYRLFGKILDYEECPVLRYAHRCQQFYKSLLMLFVITVAFASIHANNVYSIFFGVTFIVVLVLKLFFSMFCLKDWHDPTSIRNNRSRQMRMANCIWTKCRLLLWPFYGFLFPLVVYTVLSLLFRMCKPFETVFQESFAKKFNETFDLNIKEAGTNIYWLTYSYLHQNDKNNVPLIRHWLNLYSFARNLSASFFLLFIYGIYLLKFSEYSEKTVVAKWCLCFGIGAVVFWLRYYYLYYNYYSKYLFRAFLSLKEKS